MTVISNSEGFQGILSKVTRARERMRTLLFLTGLAIFVSMLGAGVVVGVLLDVIFVLGPRARTAVALVLLAVAVIGFLRYFLRPLLADPTDEEVARHVEVAHPELGNRVINALQFAREERVPSMFLLERAVAESALESDKVDFSRSFETRSLKRWGIACAAVLLVFFSSVLANPTRFFNGFNRILFPQKYIPPVGLVKIADFTPGDCTVVAGSPIPFELRVSGRGAAEAQAFLHYTYDKGAEKTLRMTRMGSGIFACRLDDVQDSFSFFAHCEGTETARYRATVIEALVVKRLSLELNYPAYTGLKPKTTQDAGGDIRAVINTKAKITVEGNRALKSAKLRFNDTQDMFLERAGSDAAWRGEFAVRENGFYTISLEDEKGYENGAAMRYSIEALEDKSPEVVIQSPAKPVEAAPGSKVKVVTKAADDYGLTAVALMLRLGDGAEETVERWGVEGARPDGTFVGEIMLKSDRFKNGDVITYYSQATDNYPDKPHTGTSALYEIKVVDKKAVFDEKVKTFEDWRAAAQELLRLQKEARAQTEAITKDTLIGAVRQQAAHVFAAQNNIRAKSLDLAARMEVSNRHETLIRDALFGVADGEMKRVARELERMGAVAKVEEIAAPRTAVLADMDKIIKVFESILQIIPKLEDQAKEKLERDEGDDIPSDAEDLLKKLDDGLKKFLKDQKEIIEASEDLAKRPVDDLTEEERKKLNEIGAREEDWSKFFNEMHSDLSALPEQDFTNPSLMKELLQTFSEVEMAKDAILKDAVKIAVPHEQLGAELAAEMTTHIEKWLTDTPDRERWSQEEPLEQYETPMAELPNELEDIVGDLMEQEEDLFEDAEDVGSSWGDSLDKGAGWDAMDGPISNYSAQGVTGNRLPNSQEVGGRAGQGRSGKSSGEMVGDTATDKGGRRTPTRLTDSPFQKGVINDQSTETPGGATGGGKESGEGGEGLEGPVPKAVQKRMGELAEKQASIRNRAERVKGMFKQVNFQTRDWDNVVQNMRGIEESFRSGRYAAAVRQRNVVIGDLKGTKQMLAGEIVVRKDNTSGLGKQTEQEIMNAREASAAPPGYEGFVQSYYESLSIEKPTGTPASAPATQGAK